MSERRRPVSASFQRNDEEFVRVRLDERTESERVERTNMPTFPSSLGSLQETDCHLNHNPHPSARKQFQRRAQIRIVQFRAYDGSINMPKHILDVSYRDTVYRLAVERAIVDTGASLNFKSTSRKSSPTDSVPQYSSSAIWNESKFFRRR